MSTYSAPVGKAIEKVEVDIVDEQNTRVIPGKIGFIRIKSDCSISTYSNEDEASRKAFIDGYFFPAIAEVSTTMPALLRRKKRRDDDI